MLAGQYDFIAQERVIYGKPAAQAIAESAEELGARRLFFVVSKTLNRQTDVIDGIRRQLGDRVVGLFDDTREHSPRDSVLATANAIRAASPDLIVTIGGGSPIDTVKVAQIVLAEDIQTEAALGEYRMSRQPEGSWHVPSSRPSPVRQIIVPTTLSAAEFSNIGGCTDRLRMLHESLPANRNTPADLSMRLQSPMVLSNPRPITGRSPAPTRQGNSRGRVLASRLALSSTPFRTSEQHRHLMEETCSRSTKQA